MKARWTIALLPSAMVVAAYAQMALAGPMDALVAAAQQEGELAVIGLPRDWCGYGDLIDGFKARYGLTVTELRPDAPSAYQLDAINPALADPMLPVPDVIDVGLSFGPAAKKDGLLQPYKVATWDTIPDSAKDTEGFWYGDYYGTLAFEINTDIVKKVPRDWPDLLASEYRNAVALAGDPLVSNQAIQAIYAAGLSAASGSTDRAAAAGLEFLAELHRAGNFVPKVGDPDLLAGGVTPILIRWDYLALADRDRLAGRPRIEVVVPKTGLVGGVYVQAISASAPHPNAAKLWMEYLYSDEGQLAWLANYCHPIRFENLVSNRKVPIKMLERLPEIKNDGAAEGPVFPTPEEQEKAKETIIKGWDDVVGVTIECPPPVVDPSAPTSLNDTQSQALVLP